MEPEYWFVVLMAALIVGAPLDFWLSMRADFRFRRQLAGRESLDDTEFVKSFYSEPDVTADIPLRLRPIYGSYFQLDPQKIHPNDLPPDIYDFDTRPLVDAIEGEFDVTISDDDQERTDGSFDSIVRLIARLREEAKDVADNLS